MKYVIDSSVAFKWEVPEADSDKALRLREASRQGIHDFVVPSVFPIEIAHAMTRAERQARISAANGWSLWRAIMAESIIVEDDIPLIPRAYAIASLARIGIYDCLYVALAERESCEFITADLRLSTNLASIFPFIVQLSTLP